MRRTSSVAHLCLLYEVRRTPSPCEPRRYSNVWRLHFSKRGLRRVRTSFPSMNGPGVAASRERTVTCLVPPSGSARARRIAGHERVWEGWCELREVATATSVVSESEQRERDVTAPQGRLAELRQDAFACRE